MKKPLIEINDNRRHSQVATPIYLVIEPPPTEEDIEKLKNEFQRVLMEALQNGTKIPYTDEGSAFAQKLLMEAYNKILPNYVSITVRIEK